eukprot:scaffold1699_cov252-Ochromonas_danica.AAC.5
MAHHIAFLKALVKRPFEELVNLHKAARREEDDSFIIDLRKDLVALEDRPTRLEVVRCFVRTTDSHGLEDTGWVINESCRVCLRCGMAFGLFLWRHHCRICGLLVCNPCSMRSNPILDAPGLEHSRICRECWQCEAQPNRHLGEGLVEAFHETSHTKEEKEIVDHPLPVETTMTTTNTANTTNTAAATTTNNATTTTNTTNTAVTTTNTRNTAVAKAPPPVIEVLPSPGFVIKTRRDNGKKVFINVYHHEDVVDDDQTLLASFPEEVLPVIYHHYHEQDETLALYDVVISPCYFTSPTTEITSPLAVQKILDSLNGSYEDSLSVQDYGRPRIRSGAKGGPLTTPQVFTRNTKMVPTAVRIVSLPDESRSVVCTESSTVLPEETSSMVSDLTYTTATSTVTLSAFLSRGSSFPLSMIASPLSSSAFEINVTEEMLVVHNNEMEEAEEKRQVEDLLRLAAKHPSALLGYQIVLSPLPAQPLPAYYSTYYYYSPQRNNGHDVSRGVARLAPWEEDNLFDKRVYVICGVMKGPHRQSYYRLSASTSCGGEARGLWLRLYRGEKKPGLSFRILRKTV